MGQSKQSIQIWQSVKWCPRAKVALEDEISIRQKPSWSCLCARHASSTILSRSCTSMAALTFTLNLTFTTQLNFVLQMFNFTCFAVYLVLFLWNVVQIETVMLSITSFTKLFTRGKLFIKVNLKSNLIDLNSFPFQNKEFIGKNFTCL